MSYNDVFGNPENCQEIPHPGTGSISAEPMLAREHKQHSNSPCIDAGDPSGSNDPGGSRADQGLFGGPDAVTAAPEYVKNLSVQAAGDTIIRLEWDQLTPGDLSYYAVYGDTAYGFVAFPPVVKCYERTVGLRLPMLIISGL